MRSRLCRSKQVSQKKARSLGFMISMNNGLNVVSLETQVSGFSRMESAKISIQKRA